MPSGRKSSRYSPEDDPDYDSFGEAAAEAEQSTDEPVEFVGGSAAKYLLGAGSTEAAERQAKNDLSAEHARVFWLLKKAGYQGSSHTLRRLIKEQTGEDGATFAWLSESFPGFPMLLRRRSVPYLFEMSAAQLLVGFGRSKIVSYLHEMYDESDGSRAHVGIVFPWPQATVMIAHTMSSLTIAGASLVLPAAVDGPTVVLSRFDSCMQAIGYDWFSDDVCC